MAREIVILKHAVPPAALPILSVAHKSTREIENHNLCRANIKLPQGQFSGLEHVAESLLMNAALNTDAASMTLASQAGRKHLSW